MAKKTKKSRRPDESEGLPPGLIPDFDGLNETPLETVRDTIKSTLGWLRSQPRDILVKDDLDLLLSLSQIGPGELDAAISKLREAWRRQRSRTRFSLVWWLRRVFLRQRPTRMLRELLAMLLNNRAVDRANGAMETFKQHQTTESIYDQLKALGAAVVPSLGRDMLEEPYSTLFGTDSLERAMRQFQGRAQLYSVGQCEFCGGPAVGILQCPDGKSWKVCHTCAKHAERIRDRHNSRVMSLRQEMASSLEDLEEAVRADSSREGFRKNLHACRSILAQLGGPPPHAAPTPRARHTAIAPRLTLGTVAREVVDWTQAILLAMANMFR